MIMSYSRESFVFDITVGVKIHTLREDKGRRWKAGRKIDHWKDNPRNVSKSPYCFGENRCTGTEAVIIHNNDGFIEVWVNSKQLTIVEALLLARNDGLEFIEFVHWFVPMAGAWWHGQIIHWTGLRYSDEFDIRIHSEEEMRSYYGHDWRHLSTDYTFFPVQMDYLLGKVVTVQRYCSHDIYKVKGTEWVVEPYMFTDQSQKQWQKTNPLMLL